MAEELMDRLINAVDNLREETQRQNGSRANRHSLQSTESEMRRLYPSINSTNVNAAPVAGNGNNCADRSYVQNIRNFQPSTNYGPKKGKKNVGQKRKRFAGTSDDENPSKEKSV